MIIRPRMPRILNRRSRMGMLGLRSLQRSMIHVRRMVISRLPERASEDIQSAIAQPLVWADYQATLPAPTEPITLDAGQQRATPFHQPGGQQSAPIRRSTSQSVQRQPKNISSAEAMPRDLQAIFNFHKDRGTIKSQNSFMDDIRAETAAKGKTPPPASQLGGTRQTTTTTTPPPPPSQPPVQRQPVDDDFPVVVEPPPPRRVRSKVEYINPNAKPSPSVQKQAETEADSGDDDPASLQAETIQRLPDEIMDEMPDDFRDDFPDITTSNVEMTDVQQAISQAEAPSSSPQVSLSRDEMPPVDEYVDEPSNLAIPLPDDDNSDAVQQAIYQAEAPSPPQVSLSRDEMPPAQEYIDEPDDETYFETLLDTPTQQPVQRASEPDISDYADDTAHDYDDNVQRVIAEAERFSDTPQSDQPSIGQRPRKLTISQSAPPMQIQPLRIDAHSADEESSFLDANLSDDSDADNEFMDMATPTAESGTENVQMQRDEPQYYGFAEPDALPERSIDLGTALFGGGEQKSRPASIRRRTSDGPLPTVMPPIGRAQHKAPPQSFIQREFEPTPEAEAYIQRATAPVADDIEYREPSVAETGLLALLDMPADTPIQQSGGAPLPSVQTSRDDNMSDLQRAVEMGEVTSEAEDTGNSEDASESSEPNPEDVKKMANQVYQIIKRRLKTEQERLRGKK